MVRVFFSWQSDIGPNANTSAIRGAIRTAAKTIAKELGETVEPDEATRDVAGSPYIPGKLAEKIRGADMFIADITTVARFADHKSIPNPNVTFELGLAVAHLGWDRVILLFNQALAPMENLPFDFDRHRISPYQVTEQKPLVTAERKSLEALVTLAIKTIIEKNPPTPRDLEGKSESELKHDRDVMNLRWFFRQMSIDLLGAHTQEMPAMLHHYAPYMYDGLIEVIRSPSFRLYDAPLEKSLRKLVKLLGDSLAYDHLYRDLRNPWVQAFGQRHSPHTDFAAERQAAAKIRRLMVSLAKRLNAIVADVRIRYIEVDLDALSRLFAKEYQDATNLN